MKKLYIAFILLSCMALNGIAQNTDPNNDAARIALNVVVADKLGNMNEDVKLALSEKLNEIATNYGMGGSKANPRFIITANVLELSKSVTNTTPVMYAYNLQFNFYIGDGIDGVKFETISISAKGVGKSEQRAYLMAFAEIDPADDKFKEFINKGQKKIIDYYTDKCDFFMKEAQTLTSQGKYDAAITKLVSVPEVCKSCYDKAMDAVGPIYQMQLDRQCKIDLAAASTAWASNQDIYGAETASQSLSKIDPSSSCYKDAQVLTATMTKRIKEIDQREWDFKLKEQQDVVDLEKATIQAARDIGVAYGENQPDVVYETAIYYWW